MASTYDGNGDELASSDTTVGGAGEKWLYDKYGNVTEHWGLGTADNTVDARATRDSYDSQNRVSGESLPGNSSPLGAAGSTSYAYDDAGNLLTETNPDGSWEGYTYDGQGNVLSETQPISGYGSDHTQVALTGSSYDAADRLASQTTPSNSSAGLTTSNAYDLASRQTGADGDANGAATSTVYNTLGWVLQTVDADGVTDSKTYDTHGCVTSETIGTKTTTSIYNADNQLATQTDADSNKLTNTIDAFGNITEAKHTNSGGTKLKDITTTFDSLCRPLLQTDTVTGLSHSWTYPVNSATGTQETVNYDATPLTSVTINRNARNVETSRAASIGSGNTVTRSVADSTTGRDTADRWIQASIQATGSSYPVIENRSFDNAAQLTSQSATYNGSSLYSGSYTYDPDTGLLAHLR